MKERKWTSVFEQTQSKTQPRVLTFSDLSQMDEKSISPADQDVQIQGYLRRETLDTFIVMQDSFDPPAHCHKCVDEVALLSPRIFAPREVIAKLKKGLIRVQGKPTFYPDRSGSPTKLGPILEIEAVSILVPEAP